MADSWQENKLNQSKIRLQKSRDHLTTEVLQFLFAIAAHKQYRGLDQAHHLLVEVFFASFIQKKID
jgi:hypothetical protein